MCSHRVYSRSVWALLSARRFFHVHTVAPIPPSPSSAKLEGSGRDEEATGFTACKSRRMHIPVGFAGRHGRRKAASAPAVVPPLAVT